MSASSAADAKDDAELSTLTKAKVCCEKYGPCALYEKLFWGIGYAVGLYPLTTIVIFLTLAAAASYGVLLIRVENRSDKLWVPQASVAQSHASWVKDHYPTAVRASSAIFFPKDGGNVLTAARVKTVMGYHAQIPKIVADGTVDLRVDSLKSAKKVVTWSPTYPGTDIGVCLQASNKCLVTSILDLWNYNITLAPASDAALLTTLNTPPYRSITGGMVDRAAVIGNVGYSPAGSATITSGGALRVTYLLENNGEFAEGRETDPNADAFEKKWLEVMQEENSDIDVVYFATRSLSDEFGATIRADIPLLSSGYFFIIGYCILMLGRCFAPRGISCCTKGGNGQFVKPKRCQCDVLGSKVLLASFGAACVGLSISVSFGLCAYLDAILGGAAADSKLFYGPVHSCLPFLLLGVGIDDMFIIANAYRLAPTHSDEPNVRKRIALRTADGMKLAGASITLTSFTDAVAFAIGSMTLLPALSSFCIFAVVGILCDYTLQLTLFVAFQALDALRVENKMVDVCPCCSPVCHNKCPEHVSAKVCPFGARVCFGAKELANGNDDEACTLYCNKAKSGDADEVDGAIEMPALPAEGASEPAGEDGAKEGASGDEKDIETGITITGVVEPISEVEESCLTTAKENNDTLTGSFCKEIYGPFILHPIVAPIIMALFGVLLGLSIWGMTGLKTEYTTRTFLPDNSYLLDYFDASDKYFGGEPLSTTVYVRPADFGSQATHDAMDSLHYRLDHADRIVANSTSSFWYSFRTYAQATSVGLDAAAFSAMMQAFAALPQYRRFAGDIEYNADKSAIVSARLKFDGKYNEEIADNVNAMKDIRTTVTGSESQSNVLGTPFPYSRSYIDFETFAVIEYELYANVGSSLIAVLVMVAVILLHPVVAFLVFACIASVILNLFGLMYIWGVNIDSVVTINLILALGFAVDYSAHVGHSYLYAQTSGTSRQRTLHALEEIGGSVLNGAISTFLAVLVLAFSGSYVFRVFFKMFFGIVLFGVLNGLVLLPVLLAYFGPGDVTLGRCSNSDGTPRRICTPCCASVAWLPLVSRIFADPSAEVAAEDVVVGASSPSTKARTTVSI